MLPPTRHADRPNPLLKGSGFELLASPRPWIQGDPRTPRRAGVDAFGFAGINGHAILREHPASADGMTPGAMLDWDSEAFLLAAPTGPRWPIASDSSATVWRGGTSRA